MVFSSVSLSNWRGRQLVTEGEEKRKAVILNERREGKTEKG
jgi:hypothetical protein